MAIIFSDNFESGNTSLWLSGFTGGGGTSEVISGAKDVGTYGLHQGITGGSLNGIWLYYDFTTPASNYVLVTFRFKVNSISGSGTVSFMGMMGNQSTSDMFRLTCVNGTWGMRVRNRDATNTVTTLSTQLIVGNWYTVDMIADFRGGNPIYKLNLEGIEVGSYTDTTTGTLNVPIEFFPQVVENSITASADVYCDNIQLIDTPLTRIKANFIKF